MFPLNVKQLESDGHEDKVKMFYNNVHVHYKECLEYFKMWFQPLSEFSCFKWLAFDDMPWENVKASITFLTDKGVHIHDSK